MLLLLRGAACDVLLSVGLFSWLADIYIYKYLYLDIHTYIYVQSLFYSLLNIFATLYVINVHQYVLGTCGVRESYITWWSWNKIPCGRCPAQALALMLGIACGWQCLTFREQITLHRHGNLPFTIRGAGKMCTVLQHGRIQDFPMGIKKHRLDSIKKHLHISWELCIGWRLTFHQGRSRSRP